MMICKIALALMLAPAQILAKKETSSAAIDKNHEIPTFQIPSQEEVTNRYVVKFRAGSKVLETRMKLASRRHHLATPDMHVGRFLPKYDAEVLYLDSEEEVKEWNEKDEVEYVELDTKVYLQTEQTPYGIDAVHAFDIPDTDVSNRKVCIIDSGYDINHPDLPSDSNVVTGYNGNLSAGAWDHDGLGHGTHVAGTIAAIGGNDEGVVGVIRNGQVKLRIVKVFSDLGWWAWGSDLISAAEECVNSGSNIVNMSLGGSGFSQFASDAFERIFKEDDVLLIAAAGNGADTGYFYPASYEHVMSVAAIDYNNNLADFSQRNDQIDIAAPGVGILSTLPSHVSSGGYSAWSGTSMAAPHVSGVAALVWSLDTSKSAAEIRGILEASAQDLGDPGRDNYYGHGLVRADRAKDLLNEFTLTPTESPTPAPPCDDDPEGWYDSGGSIFNCEWYAGNNDYCLFYGDDYENFGKTANEACCVCGGGLTSEDNGICPRGQALLQVEVVTDSNGSEENVFTVRKRNADSKFFKTKVWIEDNFEDNASEVFEMCLPKDGCYVLFMRDRGRNGMCCEFGEGGFTVTWDGYLIADFLSDLSYRRGGRKKSPKFGTC